MKDGFKHYYQPTQEEFSLLWKNATVILDTNVLLDLYRLPQSQQEEIFKALEGLKDRLWIPHQVALEFHRRRITVIEGVQKSSKEIANTIEKSSKEIQSAVEQFKLEHRSSSIEIQDTLGKLSSAINELKAAVKSIQDTEPQISQDDPTRDRLVQLYNGKTGPAPTSQKDLDRLVQNGEDRYKNLIPPGFQDSDKDKNPKTSHFWANGVLYRRMFGDLILWNQILNYTIDNKKKHVILVTSDKKADWWQIEYGRTLGPHQELIYEANTKGGIDHFWMYSAPEFAKHAKELTGAEISQPTIDKLQQVEQTEAKDSESHLWSDQAAKFNDYIRLFKSWMLQFYPDVTFSIEYQILIATQPQKGHKNGFAVVYANTSNRLNLHPEIAVASTKGANLKASGVIKEFRLVIVFPTPTAYYIKNLATEEMKMDAADIQRRYHLDGVIWGAATDPFEFIGTTSAPHHE